MAISYSYQGQSRTQNIMSFANPTVYAAVKTFNEGDQLDVEVTKNDAGYNTWASVKKIGGEVVPGKDTPKSTVPAARSTYETPEERAKKQVYIIKQSCLAQAAAYSALRKDGYPDINEHLEIAQQFVDWVLADGESEGTTSQD